MAPPLQRERQRADDVIRLLRLLPGLLDTRVIDFFSEGLWALLPPPWQGALASATPPQLATLLGGGGSPGFWGAGGSPWPLSLLAFAAAARALAFPRGGDTEPGGGSPRPPCQSPHLPPPLRRHVRPKKQHEIQRLGKLLQRLRQLTGCNRVVDVGAGQGHLSRFLAFGLGFSVTALEAQARLSTRAQQLDQALLRELLPKGGGPKPKRPPPKKKQTPTTSSFLLLVPTSLPCHLAGRLDPHEPWGEFLLPPEPPDPNPPPGPNQPPDPNNPPPDPNNSPTDTNNTPPDPNLPPDLNNPPPDPNNLPPDPNNPPPDPNHPLYPNPPQGLNPPPGPNQPPDPNNSPPDPNNPPPGPNSPPDPNHPLYPNPLQGLNHPPHPNNHLLYPDPPPDPNPPPSLNNPPPDPNFPPDPNPPPDPNHSQGLNPPLHPNDPPLDPDDPPPNPTPFLPPLTKNPLAAGGGLGGGPPILLTGLHTCGDLSPALLRHFVHDPRVAAVAVVSCCHMKLTTPPTPKPRKNGDPPPFPGTPPLAGYPLSTTVASLPGHQLSYRAREAACHALEGHLGRLREGGGTHEGVLGCPPPPHCYRAVLETLIRGADPQLRHPGVQPGRKAQGLSFQEYARLGLSRVGLDPGSVPLAGGAVGAMLEQQHKVVAFSSLALLLAPLVETLILLDRLLYLREQGFPCALVPLFNPRFSPRNLVLVASRAPLGTLLEGLDQDSDDDQDTGGVAPPPTREHPPPRAPSPQ